MIAVDPQTIAFMAANGMPTAQETRLTYTEVVPMRRLAWAQHVDFAPGVEPYEVAVSVDLEARPDAVAMTVRCDAMHDEVWSRRAEQGWVSQLARLSAVV